MNDLGDWLDQAADRVADRQSAQVETAKLVSTFFTGIAAALVASAVQVEGRPSPETASYVFLAASAALVIVVVVLDRMFEPDAKEIVAQAAVDRTPAKAVLRQLRVAKQQAVRFNNGVVRAVQVAVAIQVAVAAFAGFLAVWSLRGH